MTWSGLGGCGGLGGLEHLGGHLVVVAGGLQPPLAGGAELAGAVSARLGPVPLVFGGVVQGGEQGFDFASRDDDCVLTVRAGRFGRKAGPAGWSGVPS